MSDSEIKSENYIPYRADRSGRSHGGTILYPREDVAVNTKLLLVYSNSQVELQIIHLNLLNLVVINCYRPSDCSLTNFENPIKNMKDIVDNLPSPTPEIIICGDFNFPFIQWPEGSIRGGTQDAQSQAKLELATFTFLTQPSQNQPQGTTF